MTGTVTKRVLTGSSANTNSYTSAAFTPAAGEYLVVCAWGSGTVDTAPTCTGSANGMTFARVENDAHTLTGNDSCAFVSNQVVPGSPASMTVTVTFPTDAATGCFVACAGVTGLNGGGTLGTRQIAKTVNIGSGGAYTATFASPTLTTNPILGFVGSNGGMQATGAGVSPPSGFTEIDEPVDQSAPASGWEWASVNSGQTSTSYTFTTSVSSSRANVVLLEFDTTATGLSKPAAVSETVTISAAGSTIGASLALTAALLAGGIVNTSTDATRAENVTIAAAGVTTPQSAAGVALTNTVTAAGVVGTVAGATLPLTYTTIASSGAAGTVAVPATVTVAADGQALGLTPTLLGTYPGALLGRARPGVTRLASAPDVPAGGAATIAETAAPTAGGSVGTPSDATLPLTTATAADGLVATAAGATLPLTDTTTAAGSVDRNTGSTLPVTNTTTTAGLVGQNTASTFPLADTLTAAGLVGATTAPTLSSTATLTAAGQVGLFSDSVLVLELTTVGPAGFQVGDNLFQGAPRPVTATIAATGTMAAAVSATRPEAATIAATGQTSAFLGSTPVAETTTITAAGSVSTPAAAAVSETATITAAGLIGLSTGGSLPATSTTSAAGLVNKTTSPTPVAEAATITTTGLVGAATGAPRPVTATLLATGAAGALADASAVVTTAALTADGTIAAADAADMPVLTVTIAADGTAGGAIEPDEIQAVLAVTIIPHTLTAQS